MQQFVINGLLYCCLFGKLPAKQLLVVLFTILLTIKGLNNLEKEILFFFSAIGVLNGFFISIYFVFIFKNRNRATYFLAALLLAISVRVAKSIFFAFSPAISNTFLHVGLTACLLIGPLLYLYIKESKQNNKKWLWIIHILPVIILMVIVHIFYPYSEYRYLWKRTSTGYLGWFLFSQWLFYIIIAGVISKNEFKRVLRKEQKASELDFWIVSVISGVFLIWLAYFTTNYTSYMVGAVSFTFLLYLAIFIIAVKNKKGLAFLGKPVRYENKKINTEAAEEILNRIEVLFNDDPVFTNSDFKIKNLAELLNISPHYLSQILNDNLNISFPSFINGYRIKAATQMIERNTNLTLEAIGKECGFKSKTTFYKAFKNEKGITPAAYKRRIT